MRHGSATGLDPDGFPECEAFPDPDAGNCICPFNKNRECHDGWYDAFWFQSNFEERDEMSTPEMIDCAAHGQHAKTALKKIGSRYYCPFNGNYIHHDRLNRFKLPVTWWRDREGFYDRRPQPPLPVWLR